MCYVVPRPDSGLNSAAVTAYCQVNLPPAKLPKQVIMVADLPKNERGKVLRDKLREDWTSRNKLPINIIPGARVAESGVASKA